MKILIRTPALLHIPHRLTLAQRRQHHGYAGRYQPVTKHNRPMRIIIFTHHFLKNVAETLRMLLPLPGSETHLGGRTGQKDKHTKHLFTQFPEQLHMVGATLHGSCRNPFPPSLTDIKSHTTVHTVLQRRNETVKLRRSARKTQCQMRNMRHHHALIRLIIRRCLLVVKSGTKHIIMLSAVLLHGIGKHIQLRSINHHPLRTGLLKRNNQLTLRDIGRNLEHALHRRLGTLVDVGHTLLLNGQTLFQRPCQLLLVILRLHRLVLVFQIALNGIGQNRAERHNPLAASRTGKAHRIKMRSVAHVGIIHPHTGKTSTQIGKHPQQQTVFFTAASSCFQATDKKVGKSVVHRLRKAGSVLMELVRFKLLILSLFSLSHGTRKA